MNVSLSEVVIRFLLLLLLFKEIWLLYVLGIDMMRTRDKVHPAFYLLVFQRPEENIHSLVPQFHILSCFPPDSFFQASTLTLLCQYDVWTLSNNNMPWKEVDVYSLLHSQCLRQCLALVPKQILIKWMNGKGRSSFSIYV